MEVSISSADPMPLHVEPGDAMRPLANRTNRPPKAKKKRLIAPSFRKLLLLLHIYKYSAGQMVDEGRFNLPCHMQRSYIGFGVVGF